MLISGPLISYLLFQGSRFLKHDLKNKNSTSLTWPFFMPQDLVFYLQVGKQVEHPVLFPNGVSQYYGKCSCPSNDIMDPEPREQLFPLHMCSSAHFIITSPEIPELCTMDMVGAEMFTHIKETKKLTCSLWTSVIRLRSISVASFHSPQVEKWKLLLGMTFLSEISVARSLSVCFHVHKIWF